MADLNFQVTPIEGIANTARVAMSGAIDASTVITFQSRLEKMKTDGTRRFLLDMEGIRYVNSTGLGSLVKLADQLENEGGAIVLMKIHPKVKVVFDMLGLNAFFRIFNSDDEAVQHLKSLPPVKGGRRPEPEPEPAPAVLASRPVPAPARPAPAPAAAAHAPAHAAGGTGSVTCGGCRVTLRVSGEGAYRCPRCLTPFRVGGDGAATSVPERGTAPLHLTVNGSDACAEGLRSFVQSVAKGAGLGGEALRVVDSSVDEVVRAIVSEAYGNDRQRPFSVFIAAGSGEVALTFTDTGRAINGGALGGAKGRMDRFEVKGHPRGGNILSMAKRG